MDLSAYLLNSVVEATTPPHESEADARVRGDAIVEMVCAFDPRDAMETMLACHCVMLQFLLNAAVRDASDLTREVAIQIKARASAMALSRTLHQWVSKFEKVRKRNEVRASEAAQTTAAQVAAEPPATPRASDTRSRSAPPEIAVASVEARPVAPLLVVHGHTLPAAPSPAAALPAAANISHAGVPGPEATVAAGGRRHMA